MTCRNASYLCASPANKAWCLLPVLPFPVPGKRLTATLCNRATNVMTFYAVVGKGLVVTVHLHRFNLVVQVPYPRRSRTHPVPFPYRTRIDSSMFKTSPFSLKTDGVDMPGYNGKGQKQVVEHGRKGAAPYSLPYRSHGAPMALPWKCNENSTTFLNQSLAPKAIGRLV